ncbi:efflux transporter, RND family, MFP subunit [gut metagenome]|uniref:Efflux transporter, RND family, MFP subunit n=1 Tax=gut metagenome TaxID=749906 RepID=J9GQK5_9ZZZZ
MNVGQPLVSITQNHRLFLRADVSEKHYNLLPTLTSANFRTPYQPEVYMLKELNGKLLSYGKASDSNGYYVPITFEFDNRGNIIPGSYVEVFLLGSPMDQTITLPRTAITEEQGNFFIYQQVHNDYYQKKPVKLGSDNGESVQIISGIQEGDRVVMKGAYQVKLAGATNAIPAHSHEH